MEYLTTKQLAEKWGVDISRILRLAREGRIEGAQQFGKSWMFPIDVQKPLDARMRANKAKKEEEFYRFPFYMDHPEESFSPPLSEEEALLRTAQLKLLACDFEAAEPIFESLYNEAESVYIRISALLFLTYLTASCHNGTGFECYYSQFCLAMNELESHKPEMGLLRPGLLCLLGLYDSASDFLCFDPNYDYSPASMPLFSILPFFNKSITAEPEAMAAILGLYEMTSRQLDKSSFHYEAQLIHTMLFHGYYLQLNEKAMLRHLKKALDIAYEYDFIYPAADIYVYYSEIFNTVLLDYPKDFAESIRSNGNKIHSSYAAFMTKCQISEIYSLLSEQEYQFIFFAKQGYSYKKIAGILNLSLRTVANRYMAIFEKLGVKGKQELVELFAQSRSKNTITTGTGIQ